MFLISALMFGAGYTPMAMAYADIWLGTVLRWEKSVYSETGEDTKGYGPFVDPSISFIFDFPDLNINFGKPLAQPLIISLAQPAQAIFYDHHNEYRPRWADVQGSVTYHGYWDILDWNFSANLFISDGWYGTFTSFGGYGKPSESIMELHFDNYQPRPFAEPVDITEFSRGGLEIYLSDRGVTMPVPESPPLLLLISGLLPLVVRYALRCRRCK
jgi:hypothetical protein